MNKVKIIVNKGSEIVSKIYDKDAKATLLEGKAFSISSQFKKGGRQAIRGLNPELEKLILPEYIGVPSDHVDFVGKANAFWHDYSIKVPYSSGVDLDISTEKKKLGDGKEIDYPNNVQDYMDYTFALQSTRVAKTEEERSNASFYDFILVDAREEEQKALDEIETKDKADIQYAELIKGIASDEGKMQIKRVLLLCRTLLTKTKYTDNMSDASMRIGLNELKEDHAEKFLKIVTDPNIKDKAFVIRLIQNKLLEVNGKAYFVKGLENSVASSEKEMIAWVQNAENSKEVQALKANLKEAEKLNKN